MDTFWFVMRILCLLGTTLCLWVLATAHYRQWRSWNSKTRIHWFALSGWVFTGFYGTIENLIQNNPGGSRLIVLFLVIVLTVRALLNKENLRAESSLPWKGSSHEA